MNNKEPYEKISDIGIGKYTLTIHSTEIPWEGHDSGKMDDTPGNFLNQEVILKDCSHPNKLEALAIELGVILWSQEKDITHEPGEYSKLKHEQLVNDVLKYPQIYLQDFKKIVKEAL